MAVPCSPACRKGSGVDGGWSADDERFMREAIALAATGEGRVSPNPPVGCVIVNNGVPVGKGWHDRLGGPHAEAMALADAGDAARGGTAYVTLSPCTSHGRQPPCADALIRAGVERVVVAASDPNPCNCDGAEVLGRAGIRVEGGLLAEEAEYAARGFFKRIRTGLPYLTLKYAMTLDGRIAARTGDSRWVSGVESREWVQDFRSRVDAVLAGSGTALADDPLLNVRGAAWERRGGDTHRQPLRVVVDGGYRLPATAAMLDESRGKGGRVLVAGVEGRNPAGARALAGAGAEVLAFQESADGKVPLGELLRALAERGVDMALCEGGGGLAGALLENGLVDEAVVFVAPKIVGGQEAPGPVGGSGKTKMADAWQVKVLERRVMGEDVMVRGTVEMQRT